MARTQSNGNSHGSETIVIPDTPIGLTIAGSDCCAGAGIQADLKALTAMGVYGLTAVTAVVAETPSVVSQIEPVPAELLQAQLSLLLQSYPIMAAKTGLLPTAEHIQLVAQHLKAWKHRTIHARLVVDPIMIASSGTTLMAEAARDALCQALLPLADLITPNLPEAEALLGRADSPQELAKALAQDYQTAILLKGGHDQDTESATDLLVTPTGMTTFETPRIPGGHLLHGTGCTLSSAITGALAKGQALEDAVAQGKDYLTRCIRQAHHWSGVSALATPIQEP